MEKKLKSVANESLRPDSVESPRSRGLVVKRLQERAVELGASGSPEEWWNRKTLPEMRETVSLAQALNDIAMLSLAHLARRLASRKTEQSIKDQIALTMGPKLAIEVRQRTQAEASPETESVLKTYRIR